MKKQLNQAIVTAFTGSTLAAQLTGGLWYALAPDGVVHPFATFLVVSTDAELTSSSKDDLPLIQFNVYSVDKKPDECMDLTDALHELYDEVVLDVDGAELIGFTREMDRGPMLDPDGGWYTSTDYRAYVERER
jgi:hypothetical protein